MINVCLVADNRDVRNIGCRSTSIALSSIINDFPELNINRTITRGELLSLCNNIDYTFDIPCNISLLQAKHSALYEQLVEKINAANIVVINGEGSLIFSLTPRTDLISILMIMHICALKNKPVCVVNAIFSDSFLDSSSSLTSAFYHDDLYKVCIAYLKTTALVAVRDKASFRLLQNHQLSNLKYLPDALFSWHSLYQNEGSKLDRMLEYPQYALAHNRTEALCRQFDFRKPYVLFSGGSYASRNREQSVEPFIKLASELRAVLKKQGTELYLMECCDGDAVFRFEVTSATGIPFISVTSNIFLLGRILGNARCFVSGRYHPSILASIGGCPCIFMGSNSHKTLSLQEVLEYESCSLFSAIPLQSEITEIISATTSAMENNRRNQIEIVCKKNAELALQLPGIILSAYGEWNSQQ